MRSLQALLFALLILVTHKAHTAQTTQLSAETQVSLAVTRPVWSTAKQGDPIYAQTTFPVTVANQMALPAGTYVEGVVDSLTRPTRKSNHATLSIRFAKIIFANGYTVLLPDPAAPSDPADRVLLDIQVSMSNDLLLDNGAQMELTLGAPLTLDSSQVAAAIPLSKPLQPGGFKSATLCRPTPGYPGSPATADTVIPGTSGTPSTIIPGANGTPDIVIPGTLATPATVIPGSPATPDTPDIPCPAPPLVLSSTAATPTQRPPTTRET